MASPFKTTSPIADAPVAATAAQLNFISTLLAERVWNDVEALAASYISRAAMLNIVISWATDLDNRPEKAAELLADVRDAGEAVNILLAFLGESNEAREGGVKVDPAVYKPLTKKGASALIEWLKGLPIKGGSAGIRVERALDRMDAEAKVDAPAPVAGTDAYADSVPAGRYAIDTQVHAVNGTAFYKVDRPTEGKWAGRVFVKQIISDDEQRLSQKQGLGILARIAEVGAEAAAARYGHEIGECGMCGRTLTNDVSRERGIGPVCAAKAGW